jgi:ATP-dependent helicase HrpB
VSEPTLPIEDVIPDILDALESAGRAVLQAPPGAGKTTRVPLALMNASWLGDQRVVMLEPRRVAARAAAHRLAESIGESVGRRVGYRMRNDTVVSSRTRIEVVTEGVLTRLLQADPSLDGVGVVVFDEFHERSLHADLGLALTTESRGALRPDLRLLLMSATLDGERVAALLDNAPIVTSLGRQFPVDTFHRPPVANVRLEEHMSAVISEVAENSEGDILAF